jgi:tetratricopeptide (TPR) repeat protein
MTGRNFLLFLIFYGGVAIGQNTIREKIDSERGGSFLDPKTYEKAKSFIRRDSTYYLGYMFEGGYLFFRANDELGFKIAMRPLQKALDKIEKDYDSRLRKRTNNYNIYSENYRYHFDYGLITYFLNRCYQNIEDQEKAMEVLRHVRERNFQMEVNMDSYNTMAWLYHRNRMYTSKNFSFLKNSVMENVTAANQCLDSAIRKLKKDMPLNNGLFDPSYLNRQYLSTFHYKAMIHDYLLNIDSTNYYYDILIQNGSYSSNNYANFKLAMGELEDADLFFKEAEEKEGSIEKNTKEYFYMRGTLNTYRGHPEEADTLLSKVLERQGSTPGYGWHCIGLARAQHFEGLTAESQERTNKAARFQEMHIGTTWGQEQYNLAVASLNYINQVQFKKEYMFEHDEWYFWLNPVNWYRWVKYTIEIRHHKMLLASLVAENPEREQVIYAIFSPENLISFDEVWSVIEGFGNEYFIDIYKKKLQTDSRPKLQKFYNYFIGKLYLAEGEEEKAIQYFNAAISDDEIDDQYHTMLKARIYEGLAQASSGADKKKYTLEFYKIYPRLLPFSDLTMSFQLKEDVLEIEGTADITKDLKNSRINFTTDAKDPVVSLFYEKRNTGLEITYSVEYEGDFFLTGSLFVDENEMESAGKLLAYRLFNINKARIGERTAPAAKPEEKKEAEKKETVI